MKQFTPPPVALRRARLDNLALVPGSALPYIERCHELPNQLPENGVLILLPQNKAAQRKALLAVAKLLSAEGHQVRVLSAEEVKRQPTYEQTELEL